MTTLCVLIFLFLAVAVLLYVLLAGADFGAGVLEIPLGLLGKIRRTETETSVITKAMAPVWEANHVWIILVVVILFVAFPQIYLHLSIYLHLPMIAVLMGIVARGCAFTFRYYDTYSDQYSPLYAKVFAYSSLWTAFFLGVVAGALILGSVDIEAQTYSELYLDPWLNSFCFGMGLFTVCLFSFLAAIYLTGEAKSAGSQRVFRRCAGATNAGLIPIGLCVFALAGPRGLPLAQRFVHSPSSIGGWLAATLLLIPFWRALRTKQTTTKNIFFVRLYGALIVAAILIAFYAVQYPIALRYLKGGARVELTFEQVAAPEATLRALLWALIGGSVVIFPALVYLLRIFKWETVRKLK